MALITVKAGRCFPAEDNPYHIIPSEVPGEIKLQISPEDEMLHVLWTPRRGRTVEGDAFDLVIVPGDASFVPYQRPGAPSNGRIYVLKFSSSSQRYFFWWQTKAEAEAGEFSTNDKLLGRKINRFVQNGGDTDFTDDDLLAETDTMDLDDETSPSAGESSRRGGADGGRAPESSEKTPTSQQSQTELLASILRGINVPQEQLVKSQYSGFLTLSSLLTPSTTTAVLDSKSLRNKLLANLPPALTSDIKTEGQEKELLRKVLHSPQLAQSAAMMTVALREGGLRGVADSLGVKLDLKNAGTQGGVEIFVEGVKKEAEEDKDGDGDGDVVMN